MSAREQIRLALLSALLALALVLTPTPKSASAVDELPESSAIAVAGASTGEDDDGTDDGVTVDDAGTADTESHDDASSTLDDVEPIQDADDTATTEDAPEDGLDTASTAPAPEAGGFAHDTVITRDGRLYYLTSSGSVLTGAGWHHVNGTWYYANDESGALHVGWLKKDGHWYWFDPSDGKMATGWRTIGGKHHFFYSSGAMAAGSGWRKFGGSWYYLRSDSSAATGWLKSGGKWYYLDPATRAMAIGWRKVGGSWYYFNGSGAMATGWIKSGNKWYWLGSTGALSTGWFKLDGKWYWQDDNGCAQDEIRVINGVGWAFDSSCVWRTIGNVDQASSTRNRTQESLISHCHSTPSPGAGLCAAWVTNVFVSAGYNHRNLNADEMYDLYCRSSNLADLKPGMIVAVDSHPHTWAGSIWGHVGIYIGNGLIMENVGYIRTSDLGSWLWWYGASHQVRWGWYDNKPLA